MQDTQIVRVCVCVFERDNSHTHKHICIIVLCSSDDEYAELAIPAFQAVGGEQIFVVAGAPACMEDLQKAGIENFIHVRVNVLETLKGFNNKLGI